MPQQINFTRGSEEWKQERENCTEAEPGRFSALYYLNKNVLGHADLIPMREKAHYAMCLFAEGATGIDEIDDARVKMVKAFRGIGKTTLITKGLTIQKILQNRNTAVGIANEKLDNAKEFLSGIKHAFASNEYLQFLFPEVIPDDYRDTTWAAEKIVVNRDHHRKDPSVKAAGVGQTITGMHADMWVIDDLISDRAAENARAGSFTEIEKTNRWVKRLPPLMSNPERDPIVVSCTPWYPGDTYDFMEKYFGMTDDLDEEPDVRRRLNLRLPNGERQNLDLRRRGDIAVLEIPLLDENGKSRLPETMTAEELQKQLQRPDPEGGAFPEAQYLLNPTGGEQSEFELDDLKTFEYDGSQIRYQDQSGQIAYENLHSLNAFISVDPAFSDDHGAARTAIPVVGTNGSELFLLEDFAERGMGPYDIANQVVSFYQKYHPDKTIIETIAGQNALIEPIQRVAEDVGIGRIPIDEIKSHGKRKKEVRILGLEPWFRKGVFYHHTSQHDFRKEYARFPRGALRDILDALAFQKDAWERYMDRTNTDSAQKARWRAAEQNKIQKIRESV